MLLELLEKGVNVKALIWIACILVATILNTLLGYATGVKAGYLVFYFAVYFVAKKLCDKWDEHLEVKKRKTNCSSSTNSPDSNTIPNTDLSAISKSNLSSRRKICCPSCQTYNSHKARICSSCGEPLVGLKEKQPNAVNVTPEASPKSIETVTNRQNKTADIQDTVLNDVEVEVICVDNSPTEIATEPTPTVNNDSKNDILSNDTLPEETALIQDPIVPSAEINDTTITIPEIRFCRKCGKSLTPDSAFCNYCGTEIIKEVTDDEV